MISSRIKCSGAPSGTDIESWMKHQPPVELLVISSSWHYHDGTLLPRYLKYEQ